MCMKKIYLALFLSLLTLSSCNKGVISSTPLTSSPSNEIIKSEIKNIIDDYKLDESLSFSNYLKYSFRSHVYFNNEYYYFNYKEYEVEYYENNINIKLVDNKNTNIINVQNVELMTNLEVNVGDIVKTNEYYADTNKGGAKYEICSEDSLFALAFDNGLYAKPIVENNSISIESLGAYGDGIHDDSQIIINAINSAKELNMDTLFFNSSNYLCNSKLDIGEVNELALLGNNSTIIVNDNYDDTDYKEFFLNIWNCNDFLLSEISISYDFSRAINGIKTQVGIHNSKKIEYVNSTFNIPDSTLKLQYKDREFTNFDCYQGWEDIVINNCNFINLTDSSAGGSLWIRDFRNTGSKKIKVLNSYFHKIAHDELIAVFMGSIQNVIIRSNTFKVEDSGESSSVMNFTFGSASSKLADNIIFEKNNIDVCSTGGLIWSTNATNVIIRDNIIKSSISSKTNNNFRMIESLNENTIDLIQNNHVIFSSLLKDYSFQVHIFKNIKEVLNNTVEINCKITDLFLDVNSVIGNICNIYSNVDFISYNTKEKFKSNKISFNSCKFGSFFRYYGITLNSNIDIVDNIINYTYSESSEDASYIIMANDMYMANYVINLSNNTINTLEISKNSRFLFIAPKDEEIQNFKAFNNAIGNYNSSKNDYIKNCNVER